MSSKNKAKQPTLVINNLVAKHAREFNKAATMTDRKKREKTGYNKHRKKDLIYDHTRIAA